MKKISIIICASLVLAACTKNDSILEQPENSSRIFTLTVNAEKGIDATRALAFSGTTLTAAWATGEQVYVWNVATSAALSGTLKPSANGASARLTGAVTGTVSVGDELKLAYPSLAFDYRGQDGTLATLSSSYDFSVGTAKVIEVKGSSITAGDVSDTDKAVAFTNQQAIVKFTLLDGLTDDPVKPISFTLHASDGQLVQTAVVSGAATYGDITVTPSGETNVIYVALRNPSSGCKWTLTASDGSTEWTYTTPGPAQFKIGEYYEGTVKMKRLGKFAVSASKHVAFAPGNLQAVFAEAGSVCTWQFASRQYEVVGDAVANTKINGSGSVSEAGTVDLFGWVGESSDNDDYGINNSKKAITYGNVLGEALKHDWGHNIIDGYPADTWRTPTGGGGGEWKYLLETRTVTNSLSDGARYMLATLADTYKGMVIFPDTYTHPADVTLSGTPVYNDCSNYTATISAADWVKMDAAGAVFLPTAGYRYGTGIEDVDLVGYYWSSTNNDEGTSYQIVFRKSSVSAAEADGRHYAIAVRLVRDLD